MNKQQLLLYSLLSGALLLGMSESALAAEAAEEYTLDEYVVTANRIPTKISETAANVTVITQAEIEKGNHSTVTGILRSTNVPLEEGANGTIPFINGDKRVLILVDGIRMNWDQVITSGSKGGFNLNNIPVKNIERIEIVRGPSSSLYGSDAVGGVINIITRKPAGPSTSVATEIGNWGMRQYNFSTQNKLDNGIGYLLTAEHKRQGNSEYKDADTGETKTLHQSYLDQDTITMRLDKDLSGGHSVSFQLSHVDKDFGYGGNTEGHGAWWYYPNGYGTSKDDSIALTYKPSEDKVLRVYRNQSSEKTSYQGATIEYDVDRTATGLEWQQSSKLSVQHTLVSGVDWRQNEYKYVSQVINDTYYTKALFLEDQWKLPNKWTLTLGSRFDDHSIIGNHITSRVAANRQLSDSTNVYASWGQFVKSPLMEDLFSDAPWFKGNPNLRPETGETVTLGITTELGTGTKLQASLYKSHVQDAIAYDYVTTAPVGFAYNIDRQKRQGFDLNLQHIFSPQWSASAGYSYVKSENKGDGATDYSLDLSNSEPNGYRFGIQYNQNKWDAGLTMRAATGRSIVHFTSPSYVTFDVVANYQATPDTRLYLKGYNLTNRAYEVKSIDGFVGYMTPGAYPMPGRYFLFGIERNI